MDFRKDALKMLDEMSGIETKLDVPVISEKQQNDVDFVLEGLDEEIEKIPKKIEEKEEAQLTEDFRPRFLGKLNESPNPQEYPNGTMYKDTRSGTVYIVENGLWESLVEDGKPGAQGRQGAAGSGTGVAEVESIVETYTNSKVTSVGDVEFQNKILSNSFLSKQLRFGSIVKSHNGGVGTIGGPYTFGDQIPLTAPILGFKPFWVNLSAGSINVAGSKFAMPTSTLQDGSTLTWKTLTVSGTSSFSIPGSNGLSSPGIIVGDFVSVQSLKRIDFPDRNHLLQIRTYYNNGVSIPLVVGCASYATTMGLEYGTIFGGPYDNITTPSGSPSTGNNAYCGVGIIPIYNNNVVDILLCGDSTNVGTSSNSGIFGCGDYAKREGAKSGVLIDVYKNANGGLKTSQQFNSLKDFLKYNIFPKYAILQPWSINDGFYTSAFRNGFGYTLESAYLCVQKGIIPIFQTPPPNSNLNGSAITDWVNLFNDIKQLSATHIVVDCTTPIMDPAAPSHILNIYDSGDGTHLNQLGHEIKGKQLLNILMTLR